MRPKMLYTKNFFKQNSFTKKTRPELVRMNKRNYHILFDNYCTCCYCYGILSHSYAKEKRKQERRRRREGNRKETMCISCL